MSKMPFKIKNYGLTTVGERGQIVIPKKIRNALKIKTGNKFLVFCHDNTIINLIKPEKFDKIINNMILHLKGIKSIKK
jgi:AbrB family looped-hinge helix DNA binding protein